MSTAMMGLEEFIVSLDDTWVCDTPGIASALEHFSFR
jgi:hypothetical protein